MFGQKKIAMVMAEFLGVAVLSVVVYSMIARTSFPYFAGIGAGLTVAFLTLSIGSISGAHVNPSITTSMWVMRKITTAQAIVYIAAQMLGGVAAWWLINYFLGHNITSIAGDHFSWRILSAEALGTAVFGFGVAAAVLQDLDRARSAFVIGGSLALGILVASLASNGILNPAVAVGVQSWSWAYAVGPIIGAVVGSNIYLLMLAASGNKIDLSMVGAPSKATVKPRATTRKKTSRRKR